MAKTTKLTLSKLKEEELQEAPVTVEAQPVPATDAEVEQAVAEVTQTEPVLAEPATEETVEETAVEDPMFTPPAEGYVPAGWVKIEDLAAAVAQATGDVTPAEISPDVQAANEENAVASVPAEVVEEQPLVQEEEEEVITESVECAAEKAVAEDEANDIVSGDLPEQDKITEETCPECGKNNCECEDLKEECIGEECDDVGASLDESKKSNEVCFGTALAKKKNTLNKMTSNKELADFVEETCRPHANDKEQADYLDKLIKDIKKENFAKALMHVYNIILKGEGQGVLKEAETGKSMQEVLDAHLNEAVEDEIIEDENIEDHSIIDEEGVVEVEEEDDEGVNPETLAAVDDYIDDKNIDFMDSLSDFLSNLEDDVEDAKAESDAILDNIENAADTLEHSSEFLRSILDDEDEEYGVDLSEFDLDTDFDDTFEDEDFDDEFVEEEVEEENLEEGIVDKLKAKGFEALGGYEALEREIEDYKNNPDKYKHNPLKGIVDALLVKRGYMDEDHNWIEEKEVEDEFEDEFEESKKIDEKIIYPAGSQPTTDSNIYGEYAESAAAKRRAIASFRESIKNSRSNRRFNEALKGYSSTEEKDGDSDSWEKNKFEEKYAERQKFSYKELLENGFLG